MVTSARKEAESTLSAARSEAASTRASSRAQAQAHMERAEQAVLRLLERANLVEGDLGKLVADAKGSIWTLAESVRAGADKLRTELDIPREERASGRFARTGSPPRRATARRSRTSPLPRLPHPRPPSGLRRPPRSPAPRPPRRQRRRRPWRSPRRLRPPRRLPKARHRPPRRPRTVRRLPRRAHRRPPSGGQAAAGLGHGSGRPSPQTAAQRRFGETLVPPPATAAPREPKAESTTVGLSGVRTPAVGPRLAAFNMARAGTSRDEVATHLKEKFGLDDSTEILDDVFNRARREALGGAQPIGDRASTGPHIPSPPAGGR